MALWSILCLALNAPPVTSDATPTSQEPATEELSADEGVESSVESAQGEQPPGDLEEPATAQAEPEPIEPPSIPEPEPSFFNAETEAASDTAAPPMPATRQRRVFRPTRGYGPPAMAFVVTGNCKGCRFTDCVAVCPVECFHADGEMLYIDPDECIDCGACVPECPVEAIYDETELPEDQEEWKQINADKAPGLPVLTETADPLPTAEDRKKELGF